MATKKQSKKSKKAAKLVRKPAFKKLHIIAFSLLFGAVGAAFLYRSFAAPNSGIYLGTVQQAAAQPTQYGKNIYELHAWQGKLYSGFGDYSANSGPIAISAYDVATKQFTQEGSAATEAIYIYRELNGKLFAPAIDSKGADLVRSSSPGVWENISGVGSTHAFDMAELDGKLWMAGSIGKVATVWSSIDDGTTWQVAHSENAEIVGSVARYYFLATYKGKLYVQATDGAYPHSTAYSYDPATKVWGTAPSITISGDFFSWGRKPVEFAGYLLLLEREVISSPSNIIKYDGTARTMTNRYGNSILGSFYDYAVSDGYLYTLNSEGTVRRTKDLVAWETVGTGPKSSRTTGTGRSIAVMDGKIYVGTADSKLYEVAPQRTKGGGRN